MERRPTATQTEQQREILEAKQGLWQELRRRPPYREGLEIWRLCMVLLSFAPLFLLLAIRGDEVLPDVWTWSICSALIFIPLTLLILRLRVVWNSKAIGQLHIGSAEDSNSHILAYLFATLLPFYRTPFEGLRELLALGVALVFIVWLFWYMGLHYVNVLLAVFNYRIFTVHPPQSQSTVARTTPCVVITKRHYLQPGAVLETRQISNSLYWDISQ